MPQMSLDDIASKAGLQAQTPPPQMSLDDIAAQAGLKPNVSTASQQSSWLNDIPASVRAFGGDIATVGQDVANDAKGVIRPFIPNSMPGTQNFFSPDTTNYYNALNVTPNAIDNIATNVGHYAAYANPITDAVKGASLVADAAPAASGLLARTFSNPVTQGNIAASSVYGGLTSPNNPVEGTAGGAAIGVASPLITGAGSALVKGAQNLYAKTALPGLIDRATNSVMSTLGNPSDYAKTLKNNFTVADKNATNLMQQRYGLAKNLDSQYQDNLQEWGATPNQQSTLAEQLQNSKPILNSGGLKNAAINSYTDDLLNGDVKPDEDTLGAFNNKTFVDNLQDIKADLQDKIGNEKNTIYDNSLAHVNRWLETPPTTWQQAVQRAQNINDAPRTYAIQNNNAQDDYLQGVAGQARNALKQSVYESAANAPGSGIKQLWNNANTAYAKKMQFMQAPGESGNTLQFNKTLANAMQGSGTPDSSVFNQFLPATSQVGTDGIQHLGLLMGNQGLANQALRAYALRQPAENGLTTQTAMGLYSKLSPDQRGLLYGDTSAAPLFSAANNVAKTYGKSAAQTPHLFTGAGARHYGLHLGLPGAVGIGAGLAGGLPFDQALLLGAGLAGGSYGTGKFIGKTATPGLVNRAMAAGQAPIQPSGLLPSYLLNPAIQGAPQ